MFERFWVGTYLGHSMATFGTLFLPCRGNVRKFFTKRLSSVAQHLRHEIRFKNKKKHKSLNSITYSDSDRRLLPLRTVRIRVFPSRLLTTALEH